MMRARIIGTLAVMCLMCPEMPRANPEAPAVRTPIADSFPQLTVGASPLAPGGAGVSVANVLLPDKTTRTYIAVGSTEIPDPCALSGGGAVVKDGNAGPAGAIVTWQFEMRLKSSDRSGAVVALHWARTVHDPAAVDADSIERTYDVSLVEGHRMVLDLVRPRDLTKVLDLTKDNDPPKDTCEGVAIELGLQFQDRPELETALLAYDIWLLQTDASGKQFTERVQPRGFQGRAVEYAFARQQYEVDGSPRSTGPVSVRLSGTVKGRVRPDGKIDLLVGLERTVFVGSLGNGDGGSRQETIADGETIELAIPRLATDLRGVPKESGLYRSDTALRVTVRRIS